MIEMKMKGCDHQKDMYHVVRFHISHNPILNLNPLKIWQIHKTHTNFASNIAASSLTLEMIGVLATSKGLEYLTPPLDSYVWFQLYGLNKTENLLYGSISMKLVCS